LVNPILVSEQQMVVKTKLRIGPQDQGRRMSLRVYEFVQVDEGHHYELARGYVVVSEVPNYRHAAQIDTINDFVRAYKVNRPGTIHRILGSMDCKLLIHDLESERHPDIAIYLTKPTGPLDSTLWRTWIPEIVIEVVSASSVERDYVQKREEYWSLGVKEYWIIDANTQKVTILRRGRTQWIDKELTANDHCETKLLPGFKMPCKAIFDAANEFEEDYA
jgi:Uma2 family endonuclease